MELTKDFYLISRAALEKVLSALDDNRYVCTEDDMDNNYDIIEAEAALTGEMSRQPGRIDVVW